MTGDKVSRGDSTPLLTGALFGVGLAWAIATIPSSSCAMKYDDLDPDRPAETASPRMVVVAPYDNDTRIEITRDRYTGRLCYVLVSTGIWCETYASTLPDSLEVRP